MGLLSSNGTKNRKSAESSEKTATSTEAPKKGGIVQSGRTTTSNDAPHHN